MSNFENPPQVPRNEENNFDEALLRAIDEMKKSSETRDQILAGKKLGPAFYRGVVGILEHELGENFNANPDFENMISPAIVKKIIERVGENGFSIDNNINLEKDNEIPEENNNIRKVESPRVQDPRRSHNKHSNAGRFLEETSSRD